MNSYKVVIPEGFPLEYICARCGQIPKEIHQTSDGCYKCASCPLIEGEDSSFLDRYATKQLAKLEVQCPECEFNGGLYVYMDHYESSHIKKQDDLVTRLLAENKELKNQVSSLTASVETIATIFADQTTKLISQICKLKDDIEQLKNVKILDTLRLHEIDMRTSEIRHSRYDGKFMWHIPNFKEHSITDKIFSPPFYSSENGYKFCLKMWSTEKNGEMYLSIAVCVMRGEWNKILQWPLSTKVIVSLPMRGNMLNELQEFNLLRVPEPDTEFQEFVKYTYCKLRDLLVGSSGLYIYAVVDTKRLTSM